MPKADSPGFYPALFDGLWSAIDWHTHPIRFLMVVAAIGVASWGVLTAMVGSVSVEPQPQRAARPVPEPEPKARVKAPLALLRQYDETLWSDGADGMPSIGWGYFAGDTLELEEGLARVEFKDGAQTVIEGPCRITFERHNAARLHRGKLAALVKTHSAQGFVVDTPFATVTDLGTEFGVAVCDEAAEVEVYQGAVIMEVADSSGGGRSICLGAGGTAKADREGNLSPGTGGAGRLGIVRSIPRTGQPKSTGTDGAELLVSGVRIHGFSSELTGGTFDRAAVYVIDGSGFAPNGAGTHSTRAQFDMWQTNGTYQAPNDPLDVYPDSYIEFDLGANYDLASFKVWNFNESGGGTDRGAKNVVISVASSAGGTFTSLGSFIFDEAPGDDTTAFGQTDDLSGYSEAGNTRLIRFDITTNHGGSEDLAGLSEVRFYQVPEPSSLCLLAAGLLGLIWVRRRREK